MIGIRELARHLGLSIGTVSRALNDRDDVNRETRQRVLEAAAGARLFAQPVRPQPQARADRPRRHDRSVGPRRHADQHGLPFGAERAQAPARRARARSRDVRRGWPRGPSRRAEARDRARDRRCADHRRHGERRPAGRLSPEAQTALRHLRPDQDAGAARLCRPRFRRGGRGRGRPSRRARTRADRARAARPADALPRPRRGRLPSRA